MKILTDRQTLEIVKKRCKEALRTSAAPPMALLISHKLEPVVSYTSSVALLITLASYRIANIVREEGGREGSREVGRERGVLCENYNIAIGCPCCVQPVL